MYDIRGRQEKKKGKKVLSFPQFAGRKGRKKKIQKEKERGGPNPPFP